MTGIRKTNTDYLVNHPDPWVRYRTRVDLLGQPENDAQVKMARSEILTHPLILGLVEELVNWPGVVLNSHKSAGQLYHKLSFLAEIGLTVQDLNLSAILAKISASFGEDGLPRLSMIVPKIAGGTGQTRDAWALCDAPLLLWILAKMTAGGSTEHHNRASHYLLSLGRANGWPCAVSRELGNFRGPGRKDDPCPYATLLMLKLLLDGFEWRKREVGGGDPVSWGLESLLNLWQNSMNVHPYMFFMGNDFRKLKAPFIWYDLLHVLDVLSRSPEIHRDTRFQDMLRLMNDQANAEGLYTPESVWLAWKAWDFGQKKQPSGWLTFLASRINHRVCSRI